MGDLPVLGELRWGRKRRIKLRGTDDIKEGRF